MRPPSRRLAPGAGTARPPPLGRQGAAPGDQRAPPTPPPLPLRPNSRRRQTEETAAPHSPQRGCCTRAEGAPRPRQAPPVNRPNAPALPAAGRRRTAQTERPLQRPARGRRGREPGWGGSPPLPPPTAALTRWRPTGPRLTPTAARQPPRHEYTPGGARRRQRMAGRRPTGRGAAERPPNPLPAPPPSLRATGATLRPPGADGTPPLPQKGPRRGGGGGAAGSAHRAPQRPQPPAPAGVAADGRVHTSTPERRGDKAWGRHTAAHQNSMGAAPPMTPPMTISHSGRAEKGSGLKGPPAERFTDRPSSERARRRGVRQRQERGQGRERRAAPQRGSREAAA